MGDPSNRNQSHLLQGRSTSRVLAPPGGHSSFNIGGYGGAAASESSANRATSRDSAPQQKSAVSQPQRAPVSQARGRDVEQREPARSRDPTKTSASKTSGGRPGIPGLESHYSGGNGSRESNKYASDNGDYSGSSNRNRSYDDDDSNEPPLSPPKKLKTNIASQNGGEYAAQLKAQMSMKKNIDDDSTHHRSSGSRQDSAGSTGSSRTGNGSRTRAIADGRHDTAMQAYSNRQETDREKDYRKMQNMEDRGSNNRSNDRNHDRGYDDRDSGDSYKRDSANASNSAPVHTSTRVHAPPGGHSSFSIGWG
jgi:hypothetical protein